MEIEEIYKRYFKDVLLYVYSIAKDFTIAEEITQQTFFNALKSIDSFDGSTDIRAWLFTIGKNTFYTYCRRNRRYVDIQYLEERPDIRESFIEKIMDQEVAFQIHKYLHEMQEPYKEVFNLRVFGELSFEKIGMIFSKSSGWARVTFYRAKNMIIDYMEEINNGQG